MTDERIRLSAHRRRLAEGTAGMWGHAAMGLRVMEPKDRKN